jgi:molybdate transport system substrate-binding protein
MTVLRILLAAVVLLAMPPSSLCHARATPRDAILVFAAASLRTVLDTAAPVILRDTGVEIRASYAASSALARQIEAGAPAALFISADRDWMDYLEQRGLIQRRTRIDLLGNRLVLIAPRAEPVRLRIAPGFRLLEALGAGRLAVADPASVPAGKYARAALTALGVWSQVEPRLAPAEHVRAALLLVSRGEAPLGIVYRTDAMDDATVTIVDTFPESTHPPILYPAAQTTAASGDAAGRVLSWLHGRTARAMFERFGFTVLH